MSIAEAFERANRLNVGPRTIGTINSLTNEFGHGLAPLFCDRLEVLHLLWIEKELQSARQFGHSRNSYIEYAMQARRFSFVIHSPREN